MFGCVSDIFVGYHPLGDVCEVGRIGFLLLLDFSGCRHQVQTTLDPPKICGFLCSSEGVAPPASGYFADYLGTLQTNSGTLQTGI